MNDLDYKTSDYFDILEVRDAGEQVVIFYSFKKDMIDVLLKNPSHPLYAGFTFKHAQFLNYFKRHYLDLLAKKIEKFSDFIEAVRFGVTVPIDCCKIFCKNKKVLYGLLNTCMQGKSMFIFKVKKRTKKKEQFYGECIYNEEYNYCGFPCSSKFFLNLEKDKKTEYVKEISLNSAKHVANLIGFDENEDVKSFRDTEDNWFYI